MKGQGSGGEARRYQRRTSVFRLVAVLVLLCAPQLFAAEGLDVRTWLQRPGTKLLAVEFYATWCKPCMEAVPAWRDLHERYREEGLRLIVVSTLDPETKFALPTSVRFDAVRNRLFVVDSQRWRIQIFDKLKDYAEPQFNI